jgi:anti-anti-sigma factor
MRLRGEMEIMAINTFHADVDKTGTDEQGNKVTTVRCHGKIVTDTTGELKDLVRPLIGKGGRIVLDLGDVSHLDSSGLGALVSLKASAVNHGYCILEFENLTPRILELVKITNLTAMFGK